MSEQARFEMFLPANPRYTRPYIRLRLPDGTGDWYCWATERGGGWAQLNGPPVFDLRPATTADVEALASRTPPTAGGGQ